MKKQLDRTTRILLLTVVFLTMQAQVLTLSGAHQARLFEKAADSKNLSLEDFVPSSAADLKPVHHAGRNTIPTLEYFQYFQKRFTRQLGAAEELIGYNHSNAFFIKPGYFVAYETKGMGLCWERRGGVVIDYHRVPEGEVPQRWPSVRPNGEGLQRLVYYQTRDFMRRVSEGVTIGLAAKEDSSGDRVLDFWFTLCRRGS